MRTALTLLILASQLFTIQNAKADDSFTPVRENLPCSFENNTDFTYQINGKTKRDQWSRKGGFVIIAGEYIVTNYHVAKIPPQDLRWDISLALNKMVANVKIIREMQWLHFCNGKRLNISKAVEIALNSDIDYIVYRYPSEQVRRYSLPVPILDEYRTILQLKMPGKPGGLNIRNSSRSGFANRSPDQVPRTDTSIPFGLGDSGYPVFAIYNNKPYAFGIGVQYYPATGNGIIIPLTVIVDDVLHKTNTDLITLHNAFLAAKQPAASIP